MLLLERYEKWTSLEQRLVNMKTRTLELHRQSLQREKDPKERAQLEREIKILEESLQQSSKDCKPF